MSLQQIKKDISSLRNAIQPKDPPALVIIYDHTRRSGDEFNLDAIVEISGKDVTMLTNAEKEEILSKSHIHFFLPCKEDDVDD